MSNASHPDGSVEPSRLDPRDLARCFAGTRRLASTLLGAESLGEDAAQDVILAALQHPPRLDGGVTAWFVGALRRRMLHLRRGQARRSALHAAARAECTAPEPHEALARAEVQERLVALVLALPEPYRTPILLRYLEEHDTRAVAERLDRPLSTVQTQLQRGLILLRERLSAGERAERRDWRDALGLLCVPHPGAISARIAEQERLLRRSIQWRRSGAMLLGGAALLALFAAIVSSWGIAPNGPGPAPADISGDLPIAPSATTRSSERRAVLSALPRDPLLAYPNGAAVDRAGVQRVVLRVLAAEALIGLESAYAFVDRSAQVGVSSVVRAEDRARACRADVRGTLALELDELPSWVRVEAPGRVGALVQVTTFSEPIDIELDEACSLVVTAERGFRLLAAKVSRPEVFPMATPPFALDAELIADESATPEAARPADGLRRAVLAAGAYVVSALCERGGRKLVDTALVDLEPGSETRWLAFDERETDVELVLSRPAEPDLRWGAVLLLGHTGQVCAVAEGGGSARLHWESVPPGVHEFLLALGGVEITRRTVFVPESGGTLELSVDLPRAELTIELEGAHDTVAMGFMHGPLERPPKARRTYPFAGPRAHFPALPPGRYEAWLRTPRGFGRREVCLADGMQQLVLCEEQGADARLTYTGAAGLDRHELVLLAESGARLPITFGSFVDQAQARSFARTEHEPSSTENSVTVALPPGEYQLLCAVDGEFRPPQVVRLAAGASRALGPSAEPHRIVLAFTRAGRPVAHQAIELAGTIPGATPLDPAPGALWMYSITTDAAGRLELPLAPAHWTALLAGGALVEFDVEATTRELALEYPLSRYARR
ncbi:MAG: sigma-70 family RNA polymerase sigma factor [Planctomycetes bacterium]|nr:sigma-70 family RNA polymerase sigma factor [Planctomycetota bacterium]